MNMVAVAVVAAKYTPFELGESLLRLVLDMVYEPVEMARV